MLQSLTITQLFATFIGLYMVAAGIGLLVDRNDYDTLIVDLRENIALGFITGIVVFVLGATIITFHNIWTDPLSIVISVFGWGALFEGLVILAFRKSFLTLVNLVPLSPAILKFFGFFAILVGAWLLYGGLG